MDLKEAIDDCIDRMSRGESQEDCLRRYPQYADELAPYLGLVSQLQIGLRVEPHQDAKARGRALLEREMARRDRLEKRSSATHWWQRGWGRVMAPVAVTLALGIILYGVFVGIIPGLTPPVYAGTLEIVGVAPENPEIDDMWVTIGDIRVRRSGDHGWVNILDEEIEVNLADQGETPILVTELAEGDYDQIRLRVTKVEVSIGGTRKEANLEGPQSISLQGQGEFKARPGDTTRLELDFGNTLPRGGSGPPSFHLDQVQLRHGMQGRIAPGAGR